MEIYFYKARTEDQPSGSKKVPYSELSERLDAGNMEQYFTYEQGPPLSKAETIRVKATAKWITQEVKK